MSASPTPRLAGPFLHPSSAIENPRPQVGRAGFSRAGRWATQPKLGCKAGQLRGGWAPVLSTVIQQALNLLFYELSEGAVGCQGAEVLCGFPELMQIGSCHQVLCAVTGRIVEGHRLLLHVSTSLNLGVGCGSGEHIARRGDGTGRKLVSLACETLQPKENPARSADGAKGAGPWGQKWPEMTRQRALRVVVPAEREISEDENGEAGFAYLSPPGDAPRA